MTILYEKRFGSKIQIVTRIVVALILIIASFRITAQIPLITSREKAALLKIQDKEWTDARELLEASYRKDPSSIESLYMLAVYYSSTGNPKFQPDSARTFIDAAIDYYNKSDERSKDRLQKFPVNDQILLRLKEQIDRQALKMAFKANTIESLSSFIKRYPDAKQIRDAVLKRDSLAYQTAVGKNTAQSYHQYIKDWPESHLIEVAKEKFDERNYQEKTKNGTALELESFYNNFPESRWRNQALEKLFFLTTTDGKEETFSSFAKRFPGTKYGRLSEDLNKYRNTYYGKGLWLPVASSNKLGFMNYEGSILIRPKFDSLSYDVACSQDRTGLTLLPDGVYDKTGRKILEGSFSEVSSIGCGFILTAGLNREKNLLHESGWKPFDKPVKNAALIAGNFLAVRLEKKWQLFGLNGQEILPAVYDTIFPTSFYSVFRRSGKYLFVKNQDILGFKSGKAPAKVFDQVDQLGPNFLKVQIGSMEEVLNENLETVVPLDRHKIRYSPAGFIIEKNNSLYLADWPILKNKPFSKIEFPEPWVKTRSSLGTGLYFMQDKSEAMASADSVWFKGRFAFAKKGDSVTLFTPVKQKVTFGLEDELKFISSSDSGLFLLIRKKTQLQLFDALTGKKMVAGAYSDIQPVTKDYFIVNLKNKKGLVQKGGKQILPADYDAILYQNGWFSLLREKRFGGFNPKSNKMLKPVYDANLITFSEDLMVARKNKKWGILNLKDKPEKTLFIHDEVRYVNDSLALVRKVKSWSMLNVYSGITIADQITDWQPVENGERIIYKSGNFYGMISTATGILVEPRFREIVWLTDENQSLFMGISSLEDNRVRIEYFNHNGIILQKFETTEERLELILCDN